MNTAAARGTVPARDPVAELASLGITAFTTTRAAGNFDLGSAAAVDANTDRWLALLESLKPAVTGLVSSRQVHGDAIAVHDSPWDGWRRSDGFDAHVVCATGAAVVTVADCVPVFIAHESGTVALAHAGWRGTAAGVLPKVLAAIEARGVDVTKAHVHLGPAVCGRCYEVAPDVYEQLTGWQTTRHRNVDLRALLAEQASNAGVRHVTASAWCTRCDRDRFFSHRGGDAGRQVAVIVRGEV